MTLLTFSFFQVIDLKFELQCMKDAAREKEEQEKISQESLVQQELDASCDDSTSIAGSILESLKHEKVSLSAATSPKAVETDLEYFKVVSTFFTVLGKEEGAKKTNTESVSASCLR